MPDIYRGLYREDHPNPGDAYADTVRDVIDDVHSKGRKVCLKAVKLITFESRFQLLGQTISKLNLVETIILAFRSVVPLRSHHTKKRLNF